MLKQVAEGVLVHESEFCQSNAVVVQGRDGVLLIDAGVLGDELACLAKDLSDSGRTVVVGFSTHPHWDHLLWHPGLGEAPRYGTAAARTLSGIGCRTGSMHAGSAFPTRYRWTCSASSPACPRMPRGFRGTALRCGSSNIGRMLRAMRRC
ncbi:MBL fold metallo-hydrolase [Dactylosporangium darangshiense]|uniref:MBL fold metallo-hydrolase n=1 Tax=Dactylosporangium darangshiense TaxID=579108 RepID=UPI0036360D4F